MEFEKQKPVSDEYRENWMRIWGGGCNCERNMPYLDWTHAGSCPLYAPYVRTTYPNGCPILEDKD